MSNKRYVIKNRTFQPFQLIIRGQSYILKARNEKEKIIITETTPQINNLLKKQLITIS